MIEIFKLRVFRTLAECLNFSKAAEELHLSQPAVTSQIKMLEEGLGISLFDRIVGFARQRDRLYVGISSAVLLILVYSLVQGGR